MQSSRRGRVNVASVNAASGIVPVSLSSASSHPLVAIFRRLTEHLKQTRALVPEESRACLKRFQGRAKPVLRGELVPRLSFFSACHRIMFLQNSQLRCSLFLRRQDKKETCVVLFGSGVSSKRVHLVARQQHFPKQLLHEIFDKLSDEGGGGADSSQVLAASLGRLWDAVQLACCRFPALSLSLDLQPKAAS